MQLYFWERFTSQMEHDLYGVKNKVYETLKRNNLEIGNYTPTQQIDESKKNLI